MKAAVLHQRLVVGAGSRRGAQFLESLERRTVLSAGAAELGAAAVGTVEPPVPDMVTPAFTTPTGISGCWEGVLGAGTRNATTLCIDAMAVDGNGNFDAILTFTPYGNPDAVNAPEKQIIEAKGICDEASGRFEIEWQETRVFTGRITGTVEPYADLMWVQVDCNNNGTTVCETVRFERDGSIDPVFDPREAAAERPYFSPPQIRPRELAVDRVSRLTI